MKLVIDVSKDRNFVELDGTTIELVNVPEDLSWRMDDLREERDRAIAEADSLRKNPPSTGVSTAVARVWLHEALAGRVSCENKINCIKFIRAITNLGLREAKELVDGVIPPITYPQ